jgi:hypothetical protein
VAFFSLLSYHRRIGRGRLFLGCVFFLLYPGMFFFYLLRLSMFLGLPAAG